MRTAKPVTIVPALLVHSEKEFTEKLALVREAGFAHAQLDVVDAPFGETSWADPEKIVQATKAHPRLHVHLMVKNPAAAVAHWQDPTFERIYIDPFAVPEKKRKDLLATSAGKPLGVILNPEVDPQALAKLSGTIDHVLVLGVQPGASGQEIIPETSARVRAVREIFPEADIAVDGGVDDVTAPLLVRAGASTLVVASYLFTGDLAENLERLRTVIS